MRTSKSGSEYTVLSTGMSTSKQLALTTNRRYDQLIMSGAVQIIFAMLWCSNFGYSAALRSGASTMALQLLLRPYMIPAIGILNSQNFQNLHRALTFSAPETLSNVCITIWNSICDVNLSLLRSSALRSSEERECRWKALCLSNYRTHSPCARPLSCSGCRLPNFAVRAFLSSPVQHGLGSRLWTVNPGSEPGKLSADIGEMINHMIDLMIIGRLVNYLNCLHKQYGVWTLACLSTQRRSMAGGRWAISLSIGNWMLEWERHPECLQRWITSECSVSIAY